MIPTHTDSHIINAIQQGDEPTFDALFRTWYAPLVRYAVTMSNGNYEDAEDLVQQAFVKLWDQRTNLDVQFSMKAYLYRMVHNQALNRIRSSRTRERYATYQQRLMEHAHEPAPDQTDTELQLKYRKALDLLPPQCRQVFELSRFEALKYREIADQLNISIKTVETHMGKALKLLRHELVEFLVSVVGFFVFS